MALIAAAGKSHFLVRPAPELQTQAQLLGGRGGTRSSSQAAALTPQGALLWRPSKAQLAPFPSAVPPKHSSPLLPRPSPPPALRTVPRMNLDWISLENHKEIRTAVNSVDLLLGAYGLTLSIERKDF